MVSDISQGTMMLCTLLLLVLQESTALSSLLSQTTAPSPPPSEIDTESWLDVLNYPGQPNFDVLQKTIDFANCNTYEEVASFYDDEYVFRGSIIGPITGKEVERTQKTFRVEDGYPDLKRRPFGFTIDPDNPYRCYFMERWEGTNAGDMKVGPQDLPATNNKVKLPTHVMSLNWTPEGTIIYACLSSPLDRFEGSTSGAGAVYGLLAGAGVKVPSPSPGSLTLRFQQRLIHALGFGRNWSIEDEIPDWWKSNARGADGNDL
jgi:hypothetical protein